MGCQNADEAGVKKIYSSHVTFLLLPLRLQCSASSLLFCRSVTPSLDEGLGLAAVVDLDIDLGVLVTLVSETLQVAAVAQ